MATDPVQRSERRFGPGAKATAGVGAAVLALALPMIKLYEGTILKTYADPVLSWRVPTACTGHTGSWNGKLLQRGQTWTKAECDAMLSHDAEKYFSGMMQCVKVPLSDEEQAAWLDFNINVGNTAFCNSSAVKVLNAGDHVGACNKILDWKWVGKFDCFLEENASICGGIARRRVAQNELCLLGTV